MASRKKPLDTVEVDRLRQRAYRRAAMALHDVWEANGKGEKRAAHTRLIDIIVWQYTLVEGRSVGGTYREHLVPLAALQDKALRMFREDRTIEDVAEMLHRLLRIAYITKAEAALLNKQEGMKNGMPKDFDWESPTPDLRRRLKGFVVLTPA